MSNNRKSIAMLLKEKILLESHEPQCVITELALKHGISPNRIYNWRNKQNKTNSAVAQASDNFVELIATDGASLAILMPIEYVKTELRFLDFSFSIEGKISNQKLTSIIELLGSVC